MAREEDDATVIDVFGAGADPSVVVVRGRGQTEPVSRKQRPVALDTKASDAKVASAAENGAALARVGAEDEFILAWGRANAAVKSRGRQLMASTTLNVALVGLVGYLAYRNEQKETLVFVRDALGNVVQADAQSFLHAGDRRTEAEIKGFVQRWLMDAFSWTPLDVEDRLKACLRLVDQKAQPVVKNGLRLAERRSLVDHGVSGRVHDTQGSGKEPQIVITRTQPLEVMVSFDRYTVDRDGTASEAGHLFLRTHLKEVPRSPSNPNGLLLVDMEISEHL
jgi:hypothetical protein